MPSIQELLYVAMKKMCWELNWRESITSIEQWTRIAQHYHRSSYPATVFLYPPDGSMVERQSSSCWTWDGPTRLTGRNKKSIYGYIDFGRHGKKQRWLIHRLAWEIFWGHIPLGMQVDHLCCRSLCINPDHLDLVTPTENLRRQALHARKAFCPNGHTMAGDNVVTWAGWRQCRQCLNERKRRNYIKNGEKIRQRQKELYVQHREKRQQRRLER